MPSPPTPSPPPSPLPYRGPVAPVPPAEEDCAQCRYTGVGISYGVGLYLIAERYRLPPKTLPKTRWMLGFSAAWFALGTWRLTN